MGGILDGLFLFKVWTALRMEELPGGRVTVLGSSELLLIDLTLVKHCLSHCGLQSQGSPLLAEPAPA